LDNSSLVLYSALLVTLPVLIGIALRQIHSSSFQIIAVPWIITTVVFAIAIIKIERMRGLPHFVLSLALSFAWMLAGFFLRFFPSKELKILPEEIRSLFRTVGSIFLMFGFAWGAITLVQHLR